MAIYTIRFTPSGDYVSAFMCEKMLAYTLMLGVFQRILGDWHLSGLFVSVVFLTLTLIPLYLFTKEIFGARAALWAAIVFSLTPAINGLAGSVVKDAPFLFFMMMALYLGRKALVHPSFGCFPLAFVCAVLAAAFRFEAIIFLGVYLLWLLGNALFRPVLRPVACRGLLLFAGFPAVGLLLVGVMAASGVIPSEMVESIWSRFRDHYFQLNLLGNYHLVYDQLAAVEKNLSGGQWTNDFFEIARYNIALIYLLGLVQILLAAMFPVNLLPLYVGLRSVKPADDGLKLLGWTVAAYLLMLFFFLLTRNFLAKRYALIVVVMLTPLIGHGLELIWQRISTTGHRQLFIVCFLIVFLCPPLYRTYVEAKSDKSEIRLAGVWLRENGQAARHKIIATDERIPFYAGLWRGDYAVFPSNDELALEEIAGRENCTIIVVDLASRQVGALPDFASYLLIKEFRGEKKTVLIFERKEGSAGVLSPLPSRGA